jgi:hypothetical protein
MSRDILFDKTPEVTADNLTRNLGWTMKAKTDAGITKALTRPDVFLKERNDHITSLFEQTDYDKDAPHVGSVYRVYKQKISEFNKLGYPEKIALEKAQELADVEYNQQLEQYDITFPGAYDIALGTKQFAESHRAAASAITHGETAEDKLARKKIQIRALKEKNIVLKSGRKF